MCDTTRLDSSIREILPPYIEDKGTDGLVFREEKLPRGYFEAMCKEDN